MKSHELDRNDELLEIVVNTRFQRNVDESLPLIPPTLGIVATLLMAAGQTNDFRLNDTLPVDRTARQDRFDRTADELVEAYKSIPTSTESFLMDLTQSVIEIVGKYIDNKGLS